jgi:hypothetical protein
MMLTVYARAAYSGVSAAAAMISARHASSCSSKPTSEISSGDHVGGPSFRYAGTEQADFRAAQAPWMVRPLLPHVQGSAAAALRCLMDAAGRFMRPGARDRRHRPCDGAATSRSGG